MTGHLDDLRAQALVDGLLSAAEAAEAGAHLAACPDCRLLAGSYRTLADALDGNRAPVAVLKLDD